MRPSLKKQKQPTCLKSEIQLSWQGVPAHQVPDIGSTLVQSQNLGDRGWRTRSQS